MNREAVLQAEHITKRFPGVLANDDVNLTLHRGEILALLGENGAGKTTLMNVIYGLYHQDEGIVHIKGQPVHFSSPREAIHHGIGMVHQHFQLIPVMTVAENVILGEEETVSKRLVRSSTPAEETATAGRIRLAWGWLWRLLGPLFSIAVGLLVGQILLQLVFVISTHLISAPPIDPFDYDQLPVVEKAYLAMVAYYPEHPVVTTILVWLPLVGAALAGAVLIVVGFRYARRTWRGRARVTPNLSQMDVVVDSLIDLFSTTTASQDRQRAANRVHELSQQYGLEVDPNAYIEKLPVGTQQRVEIVKALYRHADILILDEPTAVLTPQEGRELFRIMKELAAQGVSIIFITHKLKEVFAVADSIVVMRGGKVVGETTPGEATEASLAAMMVGRTVLLRVAKSPATPGDVVMSVENLKAIDDRGAVAIDGVHFDVHTGEVLGIAGVQGNGQTELVEVLTGLRKPVTGKICIGGTEYEGKSPRDITMSGTGHVPEDRQRYGMVMAFPVADNLVLNQYYSAPYATSPSWRELPLAVAIYAVIFSLLFVVMAGVWSASLWPALQAGLNLTGTDPAKNDTPFLVALALTVLAFVIILAAAHGITTLALALIQRVLPSRSSENQGGITVDRDAVNGHAEELVKEFDIRTPTITVNGGNLSGGNQQKMIVAREFSRKPRLLIASQPTRGIDVGSIEFIHQHIIKQRDEGAAVLLVSAELDEIMALSDRIAVMYKGQIIDTLPASTVTREQLGLLMAGIKPEAVPASVAQPDQA